MVRLLHHALSIVRFMYDTILYIDSIITSLWYYCMMLSKQKPDHRKNWPCSCNKNGISPMALINTMPVNAWSVRVESTEIRHDDVIKWKHFPRYWSFVRGIIPHTKGLWRGAFMFSLICVWINGWVNNRKAGLATTYGAKGLGQRWFR